MIAMTVESNTLMWILRKTSIRINAIRAKTLTRAIIALCPISYSILCPSPQGYFSLYSFVLIRHVSHLSSASLLALDTSRYPSGIDKRQ